MLKLQLDQLRPLQEMARQLSEETCAAGLVYPAGIQDGKPIYVAREFAPVPEQAYTRRTSVAASLRPEFCTELANRARQAGAGVLLAHTHVGAQPLEGFSAIDDHGEESLSEYFTHRLGDAASFSAVVTAQNIYARVLGQKISHDVMLVGKDLIWQLLPGEKIQDNHDRQIRAFGRDGQIALQSLRVAIVGAGGTGSIVAQQLAYLGVRNLLLIDPDTVETTNLNRLVGATQDSVGQSKVEVAYRLITTINPDVHCTPLKGDVTDDAVAHHLMGMNFVFCCTDSMASRAVINQIAYQYLIPCIDMGVGIGAADEKVSYIAGRVQMLSAGLPCLVCTDKLDAEQVRREMMSEAHRQADPYIQGASVAQPAVISLNSTIASTAVTMFLAAVVGIPSAARMLTYDGVLGTLRAAAMPPRPGCITCSEQGARARGNSWRLPTRRGSP